MKKILISLILLLLIAQNLIANNERDSLLNLLEKHKKEDTVRVRILFDILQTYWYDRSDSMFEKYNKEAMTISKKLGYTKGIVYSNFYLYLAIYQINRDTIKTIAEETLKLSEANGYKEGMLIAYYEFIWYYYLHYDYKKAIGYFEKIKSEYTESMDIYIKLITYMDVILVYFNSGETEKAKECLKIYSSIRLDPMKKSFNAYKLCFLMERYDWLNDYESCRKCFTSTSKLIEELEDPGMTDRIYLSMANIEYNLGHYDRCLEIYFKLDENTKEKSSKITIYLSTCWTYYLLKEYKKAEQYGLKSLQLSKELNDTNTMLLNMVNLGMVEIELNNLIKAEEYFTNGLKISLEKNLPYFICWNNLGLAMLADKKLEFDVAEKHYQIVLKYIETNAFHDRFYINSLVAGHYFNRKDISKAKSFAGEAYSSASKYNMNDMIAQACEILYKVYATERNYKMAYAYLLQYNQINDSINRNQAIQAGLVNEFEQSMKEKEKEQKQKDLIKEKELKQQRLLRNIFITGFAFIFIISILIYRLYLQKQKANEKLNEQSIQIQEQNEELKNQNEEIRTQRDLLSEKNKSINESIFYAKRIQTAVLPKQDYVDEILQDNFILFKPRDVVSGDFYWVKQINNFIVIVVADCTGHGVPGAIMSMLGVSFINEIVQKREITQANQVLNELRKQVKHALHQTGKRGEADDGMEMALCAIDTKTNRLQYAGALNPLYLIHNGKFTETKADRMPIGFYPNEKPSFTNHEIQLTEGDLFYLFTDGFTDQFGGEKGMKFKTSSLQSLLLKNHDKPMQIQKEKLEKELYNWMNGYEQTDDILVMGVRV